jgi:hypothetical protein
VIGSGFILNDIEAKGAWLVANTLARMFPHQGDERLHVWRLDCELHQYTVHNNPLSERL